MYFLSVHTCHVKVVASKSLKLHVIELLSSQCHNNALPSGTGKEEIAAVRTFRPRSPGRRVRHMDRRGQEVQNNFLTDHIVIPTK